jgi:hypothetical protein
MWGDGLGRYGPRGKVIWGNGPQFLQMETYFHAPTV